MAAVAEDTTSSKRTKYVSCTENVDHQKTKCNQNGERRCSQCGIFVDALGHDMLKTGTTGSHSFISDLSITSILDKSLVSQQSLYEKDKQTGKEDLNFNHLIPAPLSLESKHENVARDDPRETETSLKVCSCDLDVVEGFNHEGFLNASTHRRTCDLAKCGDSEAVGFCVQCKHNLCFTHQRTHATHFKDFHQIVFPRDPEYSPKNITGSKCETHTNENLVEACAKCDELVCERCYIGLQCPGAGLSSEGHAFRKLDKLVNEVCEIYKELLEKGLERICELRQMENNTRTMLNMEKQSSEEKLEDIDVVRNAQVYIIDAECQKAKDEILKRQSKIENEFDTHIQQLIENRNQLEYLCTRARDIIEKQCNARIISQRKDISHEFANSLSAIVKRLTLKQKQTFIVKARPLDLHINLVKVPIMLSYVSSHSTKSDMCFSVSYRKDGRLLIGTDKGLKLLTIDKPPLMAYKKLGSSRGSLSALIHDGRVFLRYRANNTKIHELGVCSPDMKSVQTLFQVQGIVESIAVSGSYAAMLVHASIYRKADLVVYDFTSKQTQRIPTNLHLQRIHFLSDGHLIAAYNKDKVGKFHLEDGKLAEVWTCEGLEEGCSLCSDVNGLIYVNCCTNKTICIVSPENGVILQKLSHEMLPPHALGTMSINGDQLAVAGWNEGQVYLFSVR